MAERRKRNDTTNESFIPRTLRPNENINIDSLFQFGVLNSTCIDLRSLTDKKPLVLTLGKHGPDFDLVMHSSIRKQLLSDGELSAANQFIILENVVVHRHKICSPEFWHLWTISTLEDDGKDSETRWRNSYSDLRSLLFERRRLYLLAPNPWVLYLSMNLIYMIDGARNSVYTESITRTRFAEYDYNLDCSVLELKSLRHQFYGLYGITELVEGGTLVLAEDVQVPLSATQRKFVVHKNPWVEFFYYIDLLASSCLELAECIGKNFVQCTELLIDALSDLRGGAFYLRDIYASFLKELIVPFKDVSKESPTRIAMSKTYDLFQTFFQVINSSEIHVYFSYLRGNVICLLYCFAD